MLLQQNVIERDVKWLNVYKQKQELLCLREKKKKVDEKSFCFLFLVVLFLFLDCTGGTFNTTRRFG